MARVVYRDENYQTIYREVNAQNQEVTIGRNPDNAIVVPSKALSRNHAKIIFQNGRYILIDLKSSNGCYVNDQRVSTQEIKVGDKIRCGTVSFDFVEDVAPVRNPIIPNSPLQAPIQNPQLQNLAQVQRPTMNEPRNFGARPISSTSNYKPTMLNQPSFEEDMARHMMHAQHPQDPQTQLTGKFSPPPPQTMDQAALAPNTFDPQRSGIRPQQFNPQNEHFNQAQNHPPQTKVQPYPPQAQPRNYQPQAQNYPPQAQNYQPRQQNYQPQPRNYQPQAQELNYTSPTQNLASMPPQSFEPTQSGIPPKQHLALNDNLHGNPPQARIISQEDLQPQSDLDELQPNPASSSLPPQNDGNEQSHGSANNPPISDEESPRAEVTPARVRAERLGPSRAINNRATLSPVQRAAATSGDNFPRAGAAPKTQGSGSYRSMTGRARPRSSISNPAVPSPELLVQSSEQIQNLDIQEQPATSAQDQAPISNHEPAPSDQVHATQTAQDPEQTTSSLQNENQELHETLKSQSEVLLTLQELSSEQSEQITKLTEKLQRKVDTLEEKSQTIRELEEKLEQNLQEITLLNEDLAQSKLKQEQQSREIAQCSAKLQAEQILLRETQEEQSALKGEVLALQNTLDRNAETQRAAKDFLDTWQQRFQNMKKYSDAIQAMTKNQNLRLPPNELEQWLSIHEIIALCCDEINQL